jgi:hypothetical protein
MNDLLFECPRWMRIPWCQRLVSHVPFLSRLWTREINAALERLAEAKHELERDQLLVALNRCAVRSFGALQVAPNIDPYVDDLIRAWCRWRNAAERLHQMRQQSAGRHLDTPLALVGLEGTWADRTP